MHALGGWMKPGHALAHRSGHRRTGARIIARAGHGREVQRDGRGGKGTGCGTRGGAARGVPARAGRAAAAASDLREAGRRASGARQAA